MAAKYDEVDIFIACFTENHLRRVPHQNPGFAGNLPFEADLAGISNSLLDLFGLLINLLLVILFQKWNVEVFKNDVSHILFHMDGVHLSLKVFQQVASVLKRQT
jgi:hypothetical protein